MSAETPMPDAQRGLASPAECEQVLERIYEFLDHELDTASDDAVRAHLLGCEPCLEQFDLEQSVKSLVHRHCGSEVAPSSLRLKVMEQITVVRTTLRP